MRYLLDTHIFLWSLDAKLKIKASIRHLIENPSNIIYVSVVSILEISIKKKIGKLHLKRKISTYIEKSDFEILNVTLDHVLMLDKLPLFHRDPFDRILIAQAKSENLIFLTADQQIKKYNIKTI